MRLSFPLRVSGGDVGTTIFQTCLANALAEILAMIGVVKDNRAMLEIFEMPNN
jgi:hypothetical protein